MKILIVNGIANISITLIKTNFFMYGIWLYYLKYVYSFTRLDILEIYRQLRYIDIFRYLTFNVSKYEKMSLSLSYFNFSIDISETVFRDYNMFFKTLV